MKTNRKLLSLLLSAMALAASAGDHVVKQYNVVGPYAVSRPVMLDSVDVMGKPFSDESLLALPIGQAGNNSVTKTAGQQLSSETPYAIVQLSFDVDITSYTKATLKVDGLAGMKTFLDGKENDCKAVPLEPGSHCFAVRTLLRKGKGVKPRLTLCVDNDGALSAVRSGGKRLYSISDVLNGRRYSGVSVSHSGRYAIVDYSDTHVDGKVTRSCDVRDLASGTVVWRGEGGLRFFPGSDDLLSSRTGDKGQRQLVRTSIDDGRETVVANDVPEASWQIAPDGKSLVLSHVNKGPVEDKDIFHVVEPDDRQPAWRDRTSLSLLDLATGVVQPLTFGYGNVSLLDISKDSRYILFMTSRSRLTSRPTSLFSVWRMDLRTLQAECLVSDDGFIASAKFSPDGKSLVIMGSPECLGGIGKNVPEGRIPSMYDYQLYVFDIATKKPRALTKSFNPGISDYAWSKADGNIWFTALDRDFCHLFRCDPSTGIITQVPEPEEMVSRFGMADGAPVMVWYGEGANNSDRLYSLNISTGQSHLVEDLSLDILKEVQLGSCLPWSFVNSRGDTISCRYYMPPSSQSQSKCPMIVNYYGGCSPTIRNFESRYPQHLYASLGYVVLVVNPSGAVGWGQEFSSRHVNTAGKGVAEDIIEATREFCRQHAWVDSSRIGCIGASYGGFMTQYLQTQTDMFAAAISHAGISDHTSYWGEGYWGYNYSEVSMAGSYPWTRKDLYVNQSPLFNADKIHAPLLFLHGSDDHNVPVGESIQMFTALKLLGRPTALVVVDGEDHWVVDYSKRLKWTSTILAWFQRYLKGDASWWNAIYKPVMQ